jgi:hypothetical protein
MRRQNKFIPPTNDFFSLSVNGGIPRGHVLTALQNPKFVERSVKGGRCFLCRAEDIDVTGLCLVCRSFLSDEERQACQTYYDAA